MSTKFLSPGWRMPRNANQSKSFNYSFTGAGTVNIASPAEVGITSSYSFWMNRNSATANTAYFYNVVGTASYGMYFLNSSLIYLRYGGAYITLSSTELTNAILQINVWQNWTITRKEVSATAQDIKLYVDGVKVVEVLNTTGVGTLGSSVKQVFGGGSIIKMLDFSVFDYALSDGGISVGGTATGQVAELYNSGNPINPMALPSPPIAYYPLGTSAWNGEYLAENNAIGDYVFDFIPNDYIDTNNAILSGVSSFTASAWVNFGTSLNLPPIFYQEGPSSKIIILLRYHNSSKKFQLYSETTNGLSIAQQPNISFTPVVGQWYNIVALYDGSDLKIYLDTVEIATQTQTGTLLTGTQTFKIGQKSGDYFNGKMSNVQIFNTALSSTEIETLYNYGSPIRTLANIPQSSNLKAWYKLDASEVYNSSTTQWSIDNNQNPSAYASSLNFNPSNSDYIQINNGSSLTNGFSELTVSIWANFSSLSTHMGLISKDLVNQRSFDFRFINSSGVNLLVSTDGVNNSQTLYYPTSSITTGVWYNFIGTYDGSKLSIYVNGSLIDDTITLTGSLQNTTSNLYVGTRGYLTSNSFNGKLSNASIWNTALTSTQVTELYNNGTPSNLSSHSATSNLVSWWKLNNTTTGIEDSKGSNNGTNNGATEYAGFGY